MSQQPPDLIKSRADDIEAQAKAFVDKIRSVLVQGMRLSPDDNPAIFERMNELHRDLRSLFQEHDHLARQRAKADLRKQFEAAVAGII